jgi:glutamine synthetase
LSIFWRAVSKPVITPIRHALIGAGLPLRILDAEWGPGQIEISLDPLENVAAADAMIVLRGVVNRDRPRVRRSRHRQPLH